jgi:hypothetical protein
MMFLTTKRWQLGGWGCTLALTIACVVANLVLAQGPGADAQLASVFKDWQSRQGVLKSARYVLTGTMEYNDKELPPGSPIRPRRIVFLLDLVRKRYRMEDSEEVPNANGKEDPKEWEYRRCVRTSAYDGEALQNLTPREINRLSDDVADLSIGKGNLGPGAQFRAELTPVFFAHGIVPTVHSPLLVDHLPLTHDADDFLVAGRQLLRGQDCLLVRTEALPGNPPISDEFWINTQQQGAITRYVYFNGSNPWSRLDISWKQTAYGWWVDHWSETWSVNGSVRHVCRLRVETFEANPEVADGDFKLPVEAGMKVTVAEGPPPGKGLDPFKAAIKTYVISPSGAWVEISAKGFTTLEGKELPPERDRRWILWSLGGGAAVLGVLFFYVFRWRAKKATR